MEMRQGSDPGRPPGLGGATWGSDPDDRDAYGV
jgi:hypothetical protein